MRVGIISVFVYFHRRGAHHRGVLQPQIGPLIAALLPPDADVEIVNDAWDEPDWTKDYDLLFIGCLHSDFDRARQISHYWRRRGAKTVFGGIMASTYADLCQPYFDSVVVRPELQAKLQIRKGEMQFCNNFTILHSRTPYRDDSGHRRHLVRLWLEDRASKRMGESLLDLYVPGASRFRTAG